jgi:PhnB protein
MKLVPHINFGGRCAAAFQFYEQSLGGEIVALLTWGDSPMANDVPPAWHGKICHASLKLGANELAGVDDPSEEDEHPKGFQVLLEVDQAEEAERIFEALAEKGTVKLAMQKTFWAALFGVLTDQFGVRWEISCGRET